MSSADQRKLKILFLSPRLPFPVIGGDRLKPYNILSHLAKHHEVTLVSFYQGSYCPKEYVQNLEKLGLKLHVVLLDPIKAGLRAGVMSLFSDKPLEISYYYQPEFALLVEKLINKNNFDLGISFFMRTAEYLKKFKGKKFLMAEDCRVEYQKRSFEESSSIKQKLIRGFEYKKLKKYEPEIVNYFDVTTLVTELDIIKMKQQNSAANYRLLTNGVHTDIFKPPVSTAKRKDILFVGKLDVYANELMLEKITSQIFPQIKLQHPGIKLNIVGANPSKEIKKLISEDIILHSDVPETVSFLQSARVFLHPHSGGSGIQNKLLEAMSCGCPVVTTQTGNQGIYAEDFKEIIVCRNDQDMVENTLKLLRDDSLVENISENARKFIENRFSWSVIFEQMYGILEELFN